MKVRVQIYANEIALSHGIPFKWYTMNHDDAAERRVLGEQCRNAFEAGQCVVTYPVKD